ncbi:MAG: hypothetical protein AAGJ87_05460 [Pseudomonadota bacterium]
MVSAGAGQSKIALKFEQRPLERVTRSHRRNGFVAVVDATIFSATIIATIACVLFVAVATPIVVFISAIADLFDGDAPQSGWTTEKISERA